MNVNELFPARYLRGQDMAGPILVVITGLGMEKMRAGPGKPEESKYVLRFELAKGVTQTLKTTSHTPDGYKLPMRKTLAIDIATALKEPDTDKWIGAKVVIYPATESAAGRDVITTHARAPMVGTAKGAPPADPKAEETTH